MNPPDQRPRLPMVCTHIPKTKLSSIWSRDHLTRKACALCPRDGEDVWEQGRPKQGPSLFSAWGTAQDGPSHSPGQTLEASTVEGAFLTELWFLLSKPHYPLPLEWNRASALVFLGHGLTPATLESPVLLSIFWLQYLPYLTSGTDHLPFYSLTIPASGICPFLTLCWVLPCPLYLLKFSTPLTPISTWSGPSCL